jgi:glucosamine--fructose-6-phosphate aminotransferase (isomerizing)
MNVIKQLEGTFALLITSKQFPNELIVCRKGSPLVIGRNANGAYGLSSDMSALVNSQDIMFLDDNQLAHFTSSTPSNITLYNTLTNQIIEEHKWTHNKVELESVSKGQFDSFMEKEIFEQPISLYRTIHDNTFLDARKRIGFMNNELSNYQHSINKAQNIVLVACGTSYHSCLASRLTLSKFTNKNVYVEVAGQFAEVEPLLNNNNIYMFVSQSGETADTLEALRYVQRNSFAVCVGITNKPESAIARECHCSIDLNAGLEISVASTKAYTSQMSMFLLIAMAIRNDLTTNDMNDMLEYQLAVIRIPDVVKSSLLGTNDRIKDVAIQMQDFKSMFFIGRGNDYATALEAALKVKEIAYIHAEGLMASELKHGPLAMIDDNVCLIVFATQNKHYQKQISVIEQLKARKGKLYIVCNDNDVTMSSIMDEKYLIRVPNNHELTHHIANIIPMQLLAYHLAVKKGYSVDQPRNLAKSVTVSD